MGIFLWGLNLASLPAFMYFTSDMPSSAQLGFEPDLPSSISMIGSMSDVTAGIVILAFFRTPCGQWIRPGTRTILQTWTLCTGEESSSSNVCRYADHLDGDHCQSEKDNCIFCKIKFLQLRPKSSHLDVHLGDRAQIVWIVFVPPVVLWHRRMRLMNRVKAEMRQKWTVVFLSIIEKFKEVIHDILRIIARYFELSRRIRIAEP